MLHPWVSTWGEEIDCFVLAIERAFRFRDYLQLCAVGIVNIIGARRRENGDELILLELETGRPQRPAFAILKTESIGIIFTVADISPTILALRQDFPDTPHQNMVPENAPCCLCIDDRPWQEAKPAYTSSELLSRLLRWFERACMDEFQDLAQPLEPFFGGQTFDIVLPTAAIAASTDQDIELVGMVPSSDDPRVLIAVPHSTFQINGRTKGAIVFVSYKLPALEMSRLRKAPTNLLSLAGAMEQRGLNIIPDLTLRMQRWAVNDLNREFRLNAQLGILLEMPIVHPATGVVGGVNTVAFLTELSIGEIGVFFGEFSRNDSGAGAGISYVRLLSPAPLNEDMLSTIQIFMASVQLHFDKDLAAVLAGRQTGDPKKIVMIGAGSVGSMVSEALVREGRFSWTVVDDDIFLPHNLSRHTLLSSDIGDRKAKAVAERLNLIRQDALTTPISANILHQEDGAEQLSAKLAGADIILDASASVAVARYLSDTTAPSRRASVFFNPAGNAAVLMVEDIARTTDLRAVEAIYYEAILNEPSLATHLSQSSDRIPYAGACRALTNRMPYSRVGTLANLLAMGLGSALDAEDATLSIWSLAENGVVSLVSRTPKPLVIHRLGEWTITITAELERKIAMMRQEKLNNETGGILLGVIDLSVKRIDLVDAWPEPKDSIASSSGFERGTNGLYGAVMTAIGQTLDQIKYVGEWHSHPRRYTTSPSSIDMAQIAWLATTLAADGYPGLMIIAGDTGLSIALGAAEYSNVGS